MIERILTGRPPEPRLPKGTVDTQMHMYLPGFPRFREVRLCLSNRCRMLWPIAR